MTHDTAANNETTPPSDKQQPKMSRRGILKTAAYILPAAFVGSAGYLLGGQQAQQSAAAPDDEPDEHTAYVSGLITDEHGQPAVAGIEIYADGARHSRIQSDMLGRFEVSLPLGTYELLVSKGYEYLRKAVTVEVADRRRVELGAVQLERHLDLTAQGWYPGDLHQHSAYSDGYQDAATVFLANIASGLRWGALTDHNTVSGLGEWQRGGTRFAAGPDSYLPLLGQEVTTERGHFNVFGIDEAIDHDTSAGSADVQRIITEVRDQGGIIQLNHPHLDAPMGFADMPLVPEFDLLEVWNGKGEPNATANLATKHTWYAELNAGRFIAGTGDSDNHDITGGYLWAREGDDDSVSWMERGLYSGTPCTYVYTPDGLTADSIKQALVAGRSFVTNGPLLRISIADHGPGESVPAGGSTVQQLTITADDVRGLERLDIIVDGETVEQIELSGKLSVERVVEISLGAGQWCLVEAFGADGGYAFTNPIRITA